MSRHAAWIILPLQHLRPCSRFRDEFRRESGVQDQMVRRAVRLSKKTSTIVACLLLQLLHRCVAELTQQRGFGVVVAGDFNCALREIDHCRPDDTFSLRPDRAILHKMMSENGGPCHDIYRQHHPITSHVAGALDKV